MSVSEEIARIQRDKSTIKTKLIDLGLADGTSNLDDLASAVDGIVNQGAVKATVLEGATYTIPKGYHNGAGTVTGLTDVEGDYARYQLQSKTATPSKEQQSIYPEGGYYGLSSVVVKAIPEAYQDVTSVTATESDVLTGATFVEKDGSITAGTMPDNGAVKRTLDTTNTSFSIPLGYHNGLGNVSITLETKTATPTKSAQTISPTSGKVLSSVVVSAIPSEYIITTGATASESDILYGMTAYVNGALVTGSMKNNGNTSGTINGISQEIYTIPKGYTTGGTVSLTKDIENALAEI